MRFRYFEQSNTTATLQHWPARLVPPPRARMGAPKPAAGCDGRHHVVNRFGHDNADRHLTIVGAIGGVERARAGIETYFSLDSFTKIASQLRGVIGRGIAGSGARLNFGQLFLKQQSCHKLCISPRQKFSVRGPGPSARDPASAPPARLDARLQRTSVRCARGRKNIPRFAPTTPRSTDAHARRVRCAPREAIRSSGREHRPEEIR